MDLISKDSYIQKYASHVFSQRQEPKKRPLGVFRGKADTGPPKKKKKIKKKHLKENGSSPSPPQKTTVSSGSQRQKQNPKPAASPVTQKTKPKPDKTQTRTKSDQTKTSAKPAQSKTGKVQSQFSAVDVLRRRLHEKIEESRGQGTPKDALSAEVQAKRAKRKLERERKKRKRKELRKKLSETNETNTPDPPEVKPVTDTGATRNPDPNPRLESALVFNKVDTVEEAYKDKTLKKLNKKKSVKGQLTPLTGKNYKQLLSRVEARKAKVEQVRQKDADKARDMEDKMRWTNLLYKAEGVKIKDDETMLRGALKRKEQRRTQRKKQWSQRSENIVEKMQNRQDKRKLNLQKRKNQRTQKKKNKARKKGRVLPEDLKKAAV